MSASNWAKCPRCVRRADAALLRKEWAVFESYSHPLDVDGGA